MKCSQGMARFCCESACRPCAATSPTIPGCVDGKHHARCSGGWSSPSLPCCPCRAAMQTHEQHMNPNQPVGRRAQTGAAAAPEAARGAPQRGQWPGGCHGSVTCAAAWKDRVGGGRSHGAGERAQAGGGGHLALAACCPARLHPAGPLWASSIMLTPLVAQVGQLDAEGCCAAQASAALRAGASGGHTSRRGRRQLVAAPADQPDDAGASSRRI